MRGMLTAASVLLGTALPGAASADSLAIPEIAAIPVDGGVRLEASVLGMGDGDVTATFTVEREENGNRLSSSQSTTLPVSAGTRAVVARTTFSMATAAHLTANLAIEGRDGHLGDARLTLGPEGG